MPDGGSAAPACRPGRQRQGHPGRHGFSLLELIAILAAAAFLFGLGIPRLLDASRALRLELAAHELVSVLRTARSAAVRRGEKVGVKFFTDNDRVDYCVYRDGDGDGVRTRDIESGVDPPTMPLTSLRQLGADVRFGFPPGPPPRDPGDPHRRLGRLRDPIRFNRSDIASFGPLGESTPGSLYLTDGERLAVVRLFGRTGKAKIMFYDRSQEIWH